MLSEYFRYVVRIIPLYCPDNSEIGVRMCPKYAHGSFSKCLGDLIYMSYYQDGQILIFPTYFDTRGAISTFHSKLRNWIQYI